MLCLKLWAKTVKECIGAARSVPLSHSCPPTVMCKAACWLLGKLYLMGVLGKQSGHSIRPPFNSYWLRVPHGTDAGWHRECGGDFNQHGPTCQGVKGLHWRRSSAEGPLPNFGASGKAFRMKGCLVTWKVSQR